MDFLFWLENLLSFFTEENHRLTLGVLPPAFLEVPWDLFMGELGRGEVKSFSLKINWFGVLKCYTQTVGAVHK